jgi:hypothetical protein
MLNQAKCFCTFSKGGLLLVMLITEAFLSQGMNTSAFADKPIVNATITAGPLSERAMGPYSFTGAPGMTTTLTMPFLVSDLTGETTGWHLTMNSTQLTSGSSTIPTTASTITGTTGSCAAGGAAGVNCMQDSLTNMAPEAVALPAGDSSPPGVKFFETAAVPATGVYTITPTITVVVPGTTVPGRYASTITIVAIGADTDTPAEITFPLLFSINALNYSNKLEPASDNLLNPSQFQSTKQVSSIIVKGKQEARDVKNHLSYRERVDEKTLRNILLKLEHKLRHFHF